MAASSSKLNLASSISRLGTETAYAVAAEARALAATGKKIYPLHIGDLNFPTPSCIKEACEASLAKNQTGYCAAAGVQELRDAMAAFISRTRGVSYTAANVSIQPGGKPIIGKFFSSVCEVGDEIIFPSPGYPIYESQCDYLGCVARTYAPIETPTGYAYDLDQIRGLFSAKTKVFVFNNFANPVGISVSAEQIAEIARMCVEHDVWVLSDEAYWDIVYDISPRSIVSEPGMVERTVILHTFSKSWSMTGWRLGAAVGPERVVAAISRFNSNAEACTTQFVQWAGIVALNDERARADCMAMVDELKRRRDALVPVINEIPGFWCPKPDSTFYLWIRVTDAVRACGLGTDVEAFRKLVLAETGVSFCSREHFGVRRPGETECYIRFAYSGIDIPLALEGLALLKAFIAARSGASA
eukprot:a678194_229.p1 GENE.a678194_229~~a678194_229.p1  ORF type:complete len:423 (+),score=187.91 a678194_229:28-1269(+)